MLVLVFAIFISFQPKTSLAIGLLRDAETEWFLRTISTPLFLKAGLQPDAVNIYIVNDNSLNAFVVGGQNIFIHTGLILQVDNVNQLLAIIAHETGHISGGHNVTRGSDGASSGSNVMLVTMLLGIAAVAAGSPDAGLGLMMGGQSMAQRAVFKYTRAQEASTDQAGATLLEKTETSGRGLLETFEMFRDQELLSFNRQDPYARSHPMSRDRVSSLRQRVERSKYYNKPPNPVYEYWFKRVKAKLGGYLNNSRLTFSLYPESDTSLEARYARVYAYHKDIDWTNALREAHELIKENGKDPYFQEIVGQIHLENGNVEEAIPYYRRAVELLPNSALIMTSLAHALVATNTTENNNEAIILLEKVVRLEPENDFAWRQLGTAYAQNNLPEEASFATAEMFALYGKFPQSNHHAGIALKHYPVGSPKWLRAQDIIMKNKNIMETKEYKNRSRRQQRN
jgi:predicted Zn-dependent protease